MSIWYSCLWKNGELRGKPSTIGTLHISCKNCNAQIGNVKSTYADGEVYEEDKSFLIGIDGKITNTEELSNLLLLSPICSSTKIVLALYHRFGPKGFFRIEGSASIILFDGNNSTSILYRSFLNGNPLYYNLQNSHLIVSTDPVSLFHGNNVTDALSPLKMSMECTLRPNQFSETVFSNVSAVEHGQLLIVTEDDIQKVIRPLDEIFRSDLYYSEKEAIETYHHLLETSVANAIEPDEQYGIMLSSGMDSSSVAVFAAKILREKGHALKAYSWTLPNDKLGDESHKIKELCEMLDIPLTLFDGEQFGPFDITDFSFQLPHSPYENPLWAINNELYRIASEDGISRLFNGGYADLLFPAGRRDILVDSLKDRRFDLLIPFVRDSIKRHGWSKIYRAPELRRLISILLPERKKNKYQLREWMTEEAKKILSVLQPALSYKSDSVLLESMFSPLQAASLTHYRSLPELYGIEKIEVHRDLKLVEFAANLPSYMSYRNEQTKYFAQEAMRGLLPESIRTQPKVGNLMPLVHRSFERNRERVRKIIFNDTSAWNKYIKEDWMRQKFKPDADLEPGDIRAIWYCLNLGSWFKAIKPGGSLYDGHFFHDTQAQ